MSCTVNLVGYLGKDVEAPFTSQGGLEIFSFSVGSTTGGEKKVTSWFECKTFVDEKQRWLGDKIRGLKSGTKVYVTGDMFDETWTDKNTNQPRTKKVVRVRGVEVCEKSPGAKPQANPSNQSQNFDFGDVPF